MTAMKTRPWAGQTFDPALNESAGTLYPVIQWSHSAAGWLAEKGKVPPMAWEIRTVKFGKGQGARKVECFYAPAVSVAVLATRQRWYMRKTNDPVPAYVDGAYSRLHVLAQLRDHPDAGPVVLTLKATASKLLAQQLHAFAAGPLAHASTDGQRVPPCIVWLEIAAGDPVLAGKGDDQSEITPPVLSLPGPDDDLDTWLAARYVGDDWVRYFNSLAPQVAEWRKGKNGDDPTDEMDAVEPESVPLVQPVMDVRETVIEAYGNEYGPPAPVVEDEDPMTVLGHLRAFERECGGVPPAMSLPQVQAMSPAELATAILAQRERVWRLAMGASAALAGARVTWQMPRDWKALSSGELIEFVTAIRAAVTANGGKQ